VKSDISQQTWFWPVNSAAKPLFFENKDSYEACQKTSKTAATALPHKAVLLSHSMTIFSRSKLIMC